jgi:CO dehydrogenase maturation factor
MILGFLGKGGSGKSSVATQMVLFLHAQGNTVLAVDADHNMDLSFNLTSQLVPHMNYLGSGLHDIYTFFELPSNSTYADVFSTDTTKQFRLSPLDSITATYTNEIQERLFLMAAGPQTDTVLYGKACSHSLTTALKVYLPLLTLHEDEFVVVDEKAGADGVTTGIVTGIDVGVIVCEPSLHSIKTAKQIATLMDFYETPYIFVGNKVNGAEDKQFIETELGFTPTVYLMQASAIKRNPSALVTAWQNALSDIRTAAHDIHTNNRLERTRAKFARNRAFTTH